MYYIDDSVLPEHQEKRLICAAPLARRARMKGYVLTLCLLVGVVCSASAQQPQPMDPKLVGTWETYGGPCSPCTLSIAAKGEVSFTHAGSAIEVVYARGTAERGLDVMLAQGGKLDLSLNKKGTYLRGTYTSWSKERNNIPVSFKRK